MNCCNPATSCPQIPPPTWAPAPGRNPGTACGSVPLQVFAQCDAVFATAPVDLAPEGTGTIVFGFAGANFSRFRAAGVLIDASDYGRNTVITSGSVAQPAEHRDWEDLVSVTDVTFNGIPRTLNSNPVPLRHYSPRHGRGMYVGFLGDLTPASPSLLINVRNECRTVANGGAGITITIRAALVGWALRGGDFSGDSQGPQATPFPAVP